MMQGYRIRHGVIILDFERRGSKIKVRAFKGSKNKSDGHGALNLNRGTLPSREQQGPKESVHWFNG